MSSSPVEEKRCDLCNDVITGGECEICPKSSEDAFELHSVPNTSEENMESSEESCLIKDEEDLENIIDDMNDEQCKDNAYHSNLIQDDLFCAFCGKAKSRNGCGCFSPQKTLTISSKGFYPNSRRAHLNHSIIKYGPKISVKRKQQLSKKVKKSAEKKSKRSGDNNGEVDKPVEKPEKVPSPQEPDFVQISSDEDELDPSILEQSHEDEDDIEAESDDVFKPLKSSEKGEKMAKPVKKIAQKRKKIKDDCPLYEDTEASSIHLMLDRVFLGELDCEPQEPVEFLEDRMIIKVIYESKPLFFLLDKREIDTFKIHVENEPYVILLTITPGCAAKFNSRYKEYGKYIWPSDRCYRQKYIVLHLKNAIDGPPLEALVQLVNLNLLKKVETISQEAAEAEMKRIRESFDEQTTKPASKSEQLNTCVSTSSSQKTKVVRTSPVFKTYSTRSKKAEAEPSQTLPSQTPKTILVYQSSSKTSGSFTITSNDKLCLEPDVFLNDVIIDFYLNYLINEKLSQQDRERVHLFSTFFYLRLTQKFTDNSAEVGSPSNMHRLVKSWTKNVDIFSKDFIAIPMNESSHWFLTIICFPRMVVQKIEDNLEETVVEEPTEERCQGSEETKDSDLDDFELKCTPPKTKSKCGRKRKSKEVLPRKEWPCILIFDSLGSHRRAKAISNLRNYLNCEWRERKDSSAGDIFNTQSMKGSYPKVPLQFNFSDCGLYVLQYFESFFANPVKDYRPPINLQSWFTQETMENKRTDILNVIQKLADETKQLKSL
ncbi:sentrin-specific protease 6-like isoform X2 [Xenia sp. Carnegie-2017]|uniref:sentrin-specific protease 6-like isoform X2 n=1 Tax=Xenia sp. Carnegie-2017 TaxID=2897299 RepID=UPI001F04178E|nr:sentrin-specific protease 6-like isoform X2 [Xenia sp. Carnegie-2017]